MKQQRVLAIVLSAVLLLNLCVGSIGVQAAEVEDYVWTTGSLDNTHDLIGTVTHDTVNTLDGNGATKVVMDTENLGGRVRYSTADGQPVDLSAYNQVTIDLYVSNPEIVYGAGTLMLHRGDACTEYDLRKVVEADMSISSEYAEGWNRITYDITGDTSLSKMYHIFVWFNWHQDRVPGAYFIVDNITFSKVENPESKIENLGKDLPKPSVPVENYVWTTGGLDNTHDLIGTVTHDTVNTLDGNGATKVVMDTENLGGRVRYSTADGQPVDLSAYNQVTIDLYVSNPEIVYGAGVLMLHRGDAVTEYDLRKVVEADGTISSQYAEGWNRITYDITGDTSLSQMYHIFVWFNWHQDKVPGAYFIVDNITFSKVENPESKIENLGTELPEPPVEEPPKTGDMIDLALGIVLMAPVAFIVISKKRKNQN